MDEMQALAQSLGEYTVSTLGRENLRALQVTVHPRESSAFMLIALEDGGDMSQREVIRHMFDIERMYIDELTLTYVFVEDVPMAEGAESLRPQFVYA